MKTLRRCLKALFYLLGIVSALFLCLLTISNLQDDPLSEAARQALTYTQPTEQALQDNGYLIIAGLDAPANGEPVTSAIERGHQRLAQEIVRWRWLTQQPNLDVTAMPPFLEGPGYETSAVMPTTVRCPTSVQDCFAWYQQQHSHIDELLHTHQALLTRFAASANARQFSNPFPQFAEADRLLYAPLTATHELLLARAANQWMAGQPAAALDTLAQTARLRTRLTEYAGDMVDAMTALAMHYRELRWLSNAIAHPTALPDATIDQRIQLLLATPPAPLHSAMNGEIRMAAFSYHHDLRGGIMQRRQNLRENDAWWAFISSYFHTYALLYNQTTNDAVDFLQRFQAIATLPAHEFAAANEQLMEYACKKLDIRTHGLRNATGNVLIESILDMYASYPQRIADIDGYRRLVLLQLQAATTKVAPANMPVWLAQSPAALRNPYTLQPMQWDAASVSLVFEGKQRQTQNPDNASTYRIALFSPERP